MSKIGNEIKMFQLLSNGKLYKIKELADILEVSERQIRTYKFDLEQAGYRIESYNGRNGGYFCNPSNKNIIFSLTELNNLEKLYQTFDDDDDERKELLLETIEKLRYLLFYSNNINNKESENNKKFLELLLKAINDKKIITLHIKKDNKDSLRKFFPHSIYRNNNCYYVTGIAMDSNEYRTYSFEEIKDID